MKSTFLSTSFLPALCAVSVFGLLASGMSLAQEVKADPAKVAAALEFAPKKPASKSLAMPAPSCGPNVVWGQNLPSLLTPTASFPTTEPMSDCAFHEWSWESFMWATAMVPAATNSSTMVPRFLTLPTIKDLFTKGFNPNQAPTQALMLSLGTRVHSNAAGKPVAAIVENAGAIIEADGNVLIAQDGYPVFASVHMNAPYFTTVLNNLIENGNYLKNNNQANDAFPVGSIVFKATWRRYDGVAPAGSYTTQANIPQLTFANGVVVPAKDNNGNVITKLVNVALVGLHVVGRTDAHPEFLWGTFEQKQNAPMVADGAFNTSCPSKGSTPCVDTDSNNYTFYQANTPFAKANLATVPFPAPMTPPISFNVATQKFYPPTQVVQANRTGGETAGGITNIATLNTAGPQFLAQQGAQAVFQHYNLIGTVWLKPHSYTRTSRSDWWNLALSNPIGSVNLANSTAETFQQVVPNGNTQGSNCFACHNPTSFGGTSGTLNANGSFIPVGSPTIGTTGLPARLLGISHVLGAQTVNAVQNQVPAAIGPMCTAVNAGPIMSNVEAQTICPQVCATSPSGKWNKQWVTTQAGVQSICQCCQN